MKKETLSNKKRDLMQDCLSEAFWSRSLPLGVASGLVALLAVKTGKIKVKSGRASSWSVVVGFASMGYVIGKFNYILGDRCRDVFLRVNTASPVDRRGDIQMQGNERELARRLVHIIADTDEDDMSDTEIEILSDCNTVANFKYGYPFSGLFGGAMYLAVKANILKESRIITYFPRLPKTLFGATLGYFFGSYVYYNSIDCPKRFQRYDYSGRIAQLLREETLQICQSCQAQQLLEEDLEVQDYIFPCVDVCADLRASIQETWRQNYFLSPFFKT